MIPATILDAVWARQRLAAERRARHGVTPAHLLTVQLLRNGTA